MIAGPDAQMNPNLLEIHMTDINLIRAKTGFICDMDGVLYQGTCCCPEPSSLSNG